MNRRTILLVLGMLVASVPGFGAPASSTTPLIVDHDITRVIDGDTIQIGDTVLQLAGIDAPELGQTCLHDGQYRSCGLDAAYGLKKLIDLTATQRIACTRVNASDGILVATCIRGREDLSLAILDSGHAVAVAEGSPVYVAAEAPLFAVAQRLAKAASLGIWTTKFTLPWIWRQERDNTDRAGDDNPACIVKGKVTGEGDRLYYGPLDAEYDRLAIDRDMGDRFFCSDDQARAAGWLRAGQTAAQR